MKLPFLYKNNSADSSWPWPSCHQQPKTLSFRTNNNNMVKTINSACLDMVEWTRESTFTHSSESASGTISTAVSDDVTQPTEQESIETLIKGLRSSERLIFEQKGVTKSILEEANNNSNANSYTKKHKEGSFMLLPMESKDPYFDFKKSMEEMVEAHGLKDWDNLEKLLCWYLKVNGKSNHGYIFGAFVDLLVGFSLVETNTSINSIPSSSATTATSTSTSCSCSNLRESPSSSLSFYTSCSSSDESCSVPRVSSLEAEEDEEEVIDNIDASCLSCLLEIEDKIKDLDLDGYVSC